MWVRLSVREGERTGQKRQCEGVSRDRAYAIFWSIVAFISSSVASGLIDRVGAAVAAGDDTLCFGWESTLEATTSSG